MDWKVLATIFTTVFLAELGDKTQLATMLFSSDSGASKLQIFIAASSALVLSTAIAVAVGDTVARFISPATLQVIAGVGFIAIGSWTLYAALSK